MYYLSFTIRLNEQILFAWENIVFAADNLVPAKPWEVWNFLRNTTCFDFATYNLIPLSEAKLTSGFIRTPHAAGLLVLWTKSILQCIRSNSSRGKSIFKHANIVFELPQYLKQSARIFRIQELYCTVAHLSHEMCPSPRLFVKLSIRHHQTQRTRRPLGPLKLVFHSLIHKQSWSSKRLCNYSIGIFSTCIKIYS